MTITKRELIDYYVFASTKADQEVVGIFIEVALTDMEPHTKHVFADNSGSILIIKGAR